MDELVCRLGMTRKNRCRMHEILFIAKKYSLLLPDIILIFLQIRLKNPEVLRQAAFFASKLHVALSKGARNGNVPRQAPVGSPRDQGTPVRMGGAQGSVKFAQFRRVNVFRCTQEVLDAGNNNDAKTGKSTLEQINETKQFPIYEEYEKVPGEKK
ncbi:hypothetical protein HELRODRAFT_161970 [Helobdella robusta]|uniref:Uncharacterized protein n=1 Tax=Helobdella robusta TaxID=6412 RepID=T1ES38_HELRO|nr:hypothetical protein HELRODRAFT_161970 [Helobdella robusta]ESO02678.1 hypothetical protein HELRODRAFT_161970 [Helobdella robusta]